MRLFYWSKHITQVLANKPDLSSVTDFLNDDVDAVFAQQ